MTRLPIFVEVGKISLQKDRLTPIDPENFQVEHFKRAVIDAAFSDDGNRCNAKLIVDLRARTITVSCKGPQFTARRVGEALMVEYMVFTNSAYVIDTLNKAPTEMREVGEFGFGIDLDRFLGFLHRLHERGRTQLIYDSRT